MFSFIELLWIDIFCKAENLFVLDNLDPGGSI